MSEIDKRTVSLPQEYAVYVGRMVAAGLYASASEVIKAGLHSLQERDASVESWLREEVVQTYDALKADPTRVVSTEALNVNLRNHHFDRS